MAMYFLLEDFDQRAQENCYRNAVPLLVRAWINISIRSLGLPSRYNLFGENEFKLSETYLSHLFESKKSINKIIVGVCAIPVLSSIVSISLLYHWSLYKQIVYFLEDPEMVDRKRLVKLKSWYENKSDLFLFGWYFNKKIRKLIFRKIQTIHHSNFEININITKHRTYHFNQVYNTVNNSFNYNYTSKENHTINNFYNSNDLSIKGFKSDYHNEHFKLLHYELVQIKMLENESRDSFISFYHNVPSEVLNKITTPIKWCGNRRLLVFLFLYMIEVKVISRSEKNGLYSKISELFFLKIDGDLKGSNLAQPETIFNNKGGVLKYPEFNSNPLYNEIVTIVDRTFTGKS